MKEKLIDKMFELGVIKLQPDNPFCWKSGYYMPVYNDNRLLTGSPEAWEVAINSLEEKISDIESIDFIAGVATAGISHGAVLSYKTKLPFIYTRDKPKDHGTGQKIEGVNVEKIKGKRVLVVEDLISTGGSSLSTIETIRNAGGIVDVCISIFNYGFSGKYDKISKADPVCEVRSVLYFPELVEYAEKKEMFSKEQIDSLRCWYKDPFEWGEKHGFLPKK